MAAGDQIDIFCAGILQSQAYFDEFICADRASHAVLRNLKILAECTAECTAGEKNCTAATVYRDQRFLTEVEARNRDTHSAQLTAKTGSAGSSVGTAAT